MTTDQRTERRDGARSSGRGRRTSTGRLAAFSIALLALIGLGLAVAGPAMAADATIGPYVEGQHIYGEGTVLTKAATARVEKLAAHIEAQGGGRVVVWLEPDYTSMPSGTQIMDAWAVDGLVISGEGRYPGLEIGSMLKAKLSTTQYKSIDGNSSPGMSTAESWITSTLARIDGYLGGQHVFDGPGLLDASALADAESAAVKLGKDLAATVYVDISYGGDGPDSTAFFIGADMSSVFDNMLYIALSVTDNTVGGFMNSDSNLWDTYNTSSPWTNSTMKDHDAPNGDVPGELLKAIKAVTKPSLLPVVGITSDALPVIIFVIFIVGFSITAPFVWGPWLIRRMAGVSDPVKNGVPGTAVIESIGETGVTVSMPSVGPDAPDYKLGLQVTPSDGSPAYHADIKALIPRIFVPMIVPGRQIGVTIDPSNRNKVAIDFANFHGGGTAPAASAPSDGGMELNFDAAGQPDAAQVANIVGRVHQGTMPLIHGSADQLLATGTHGTAVITTTQPLGKTVRDVNPKADPSRLDDPMWMFTLEVKLPGRDPFPAVMGHRVPVSKVALLAPGVKLAVAVNEADEHNEVAIDWEKSPIA